MSSAETVTNSYSLVSPRFWHGMPSKVWLPLLWKNGFQIEWSRLHLALGVTAFMPFSDVMALTQHLLFGKKIARSKLAGPPIFVLGHWRSGTTLLHEYLGLDDRFASPTTFQCFAPLNFLLTEKLVSKYGAWLIPDKRPMDNMKAGWSLPQEDEFALMNLGAPTPYVRMMFPKNGFPYENTLSTEGFTDDERARWTQIFDWFLRALSYKYGKPLILKSPPHTGRIALIREMYPDAKFIHIVRDPRKLFPSTLNLWKALDQVQGLQNAVPVEELQAFVFRCLNEMYQSFELGRVGLQPNQIVDVRYESLIKDPVGVMANAYSQLELGSFDSVRSKLLTKCEQEREFKPNRFVLDPALEERILSEWHDYAERYDYLSSRHSPQTS